MKTRILAQNDYPKECLNPITGKNEMCVATNLHMMCETLLNYRWTQKEFYEIMRKTLCISQSGYVNSYEKAYYVLSMHRKWWQRSQKREWVFTNDMQAIIKALETRPVILFLGGHAVLATEYIRAREMFSVVDPYLKPASNPIILTRPIRRAGFFL
jgi:peptidase C39-like protein